MCSQFLRCGLDLTAVSRDIVSMNGEWKLRSGRLKGMHILMDVEEFGNVQVFIWISQNMRYRNVCRGLNKYMWVCRNLQYEIKVNFGNPSRKSFLTYRKPSIWHHQHGANRVIHYKSHSKNREHCNVKLPHIACAAHLRKAQYIERLRVWEICCLVA